MPYLLGNLSMLPFENLPEKEQNAWNDDGGTSILERSSSRFGPFRGFHGHFGNEKHLAASEKNSFKMQSKKDGVSLFQKTYKLQCSDDKESIDISGKGTWAFNGNLGMPESLNFKYNITFKENGVTVDIPVTIQYQRLSGKKLADYEKEQQEKEAQTKRKREETLTEQKAPLTASETREILADLQSGERYRQMKAIAKLGMKKDLQADPEIVQAVQLLLSTKDEMIHRMVQRVASKLTPELRKKSKINEAYENFMPLKEAELGPIPTDILSLPPGLLIAAKEHHRWKAARIKKALEHGNYEIEYQGTHWKGTVAWNNIRLAPPEVEQTFVDKAKLKKLYANYVGPVVEKAPAVTPSERGYRTWADNSGTFAIVAKYLRTEGTNVFLQRKDGEEIKVPFSRLSESDRQVAKRLKENPAPTNPFQTNPFK